MTPTRGELEQQARLRDTDIQPIGWVFLAWTVGVFFYFAKFMGGWIRLRRIIAGGVLITSGRVVECLDDSCRRMPLRRRPRLLVSGEAGGPFLAGLFRPAMVLPDEVAGGCSPDELEVAMCHELAHLKRRDLWWNWLAALAEWFFFFHPLLWWAKREWIVAREIATDESAIAASRMDVAQYGKSLLALMTKAAARRPSLYLTAGVSEAYSQLSRRMVAMRTIHKSSRRRRIGLATGLTAIAFVGLVPWKLMAREAVVGTKPVEASQISADRDVKSHDGEASRMVRGIVRDELGQPVQGATIFVGLFRGEDPQRQILRTDDEGRFTTPFTYDENPLVIAYKEGKSLASHWVGQVGKKPRQDMDPVSLTLSEPVPFVGMVRDADGDPIPGARVRVEILVHPTNAY